VRASDFPVVPLRRPKAVSTNAFGQGDAQLAKVTDLLVTFGGLTALRRRREWETQRFKSSRGGSGEAYGEERAEWLRYLRRGDSEVVL